MRYATKGLGLGAVLTAACLVGPAATATAGPAGPAGADGPSGPSVLVLTVAEGEDPATAPERRSAVLTCPPGSGTHPAPGRACAALRSVDGEVGALVETDGDRICPMIWDPVTITAEGVWKGREVSYERTFANSCVMEGATGPVFSF